MELSQFHRDVVFGQAGGKIIWQPRIGCWYADKMFAGEDLPAPFTGMSLEDVYRTLGCSQRLYSWYNRCCWTGYRPSTLMKHFLWRP